ncbi:MAG: hypothetical protein ABI947_24685 [Chloroflexota bacterium]
MKHFNAWCAHILMIIILIAVTACSTAAKPISSTPEVSSSEMNTATALARTRQAQEQSLVTLCKKISSLSVATRFSKSVNKFIVINTTDGRVDDNYQAALSPDEKADSGQQATVLVCVETKQTNVETCNYTKPNSNESIRTILRIRQDDQVSLIDLANRTLVGQSTITGEDPNNCTRNIPSSTDSQFMVGNRAPPILLLNWLHDVGKTTK